MGSTTAAPPAPSALGETLGRCGALGIEDFPTRFTVGAAEGEGWISRDDLLDPDMRVVPMELFGRVAQSRRTAVRGVWLLEAYVGAVAAPAILTALTESRMPDVAADAVRVRFTDDGEPAEVRFRRPAMAVLPGDAAAGDPGVVLVRDRDALWAWFRGRLIPHLEPVVEALAPVVRRSRRALWRCVCDSLGGYLEWLGDGVGRGEAARCDEALLLGVDPPLLGTRRREEVRWSGGTRVVAVRSGCCLSYRREGRGGRGCFGCPRTTSEERVARMEESG
ncbi:MAG TPA: IucA/IucC family C-terminal-domain containing protein [Miltoncostaeaceae bacterium]|nr:IucA/IucC family C-terminal-domain containing protein [Miltoncostaeaceae bacterium]